MDNVFIIPFKDNERIQNGYINAIKTLGINYILFDPEYKLNTKKIVNENNINRIILRYQDIDKIPFCLELKDDIDIHIIDTEFDFFIDHTLCSDKKICFNSKILIITEDYKDHYLLNIIRQLQILGIDFNITTDKLSSQDIRGLPEVFETVIVVNPRNSDICHSLSVCGLFVLSNTDNMFADHFKSSIELFEEIDKIQKMNIDKKRERVKNMFKILKNNRFYFDFIIDNFKLDDSLKESIRNKFEFDYLTRLGL